MNPKKPARVVFITGTDTEVGKTVTTFALGALLKQQGRHVGVFKPVQCAGHDAQFLKRGLSLPDPLQTINPCFARKPLSPNVAFARQKQRVDLAAIKGAFDRLSARHEVLLVEGAGGLLVPLVRDYLVGDLFQDLVPSGDMVIVARLGLGTINHTLLTLRQARQMGFEVKGIVFSKTHDQRRGIAEMTNPGIIEDLGQVPVLGTIPYLKRFEEKAVVRKCAKCLDVISLTKGWGPQKIKEGEINKGVRHGP